MTVDSRDYLFPFSGMIWIDAAIILAQLAS